MAKRAAQKPRASSRNTVAKRRVQGFNEYRCDDCGWIYRPKAHGGLDIDDQQPGWVCDECQAGRDHFQVLVPRSDDLADDEDDGATTSTHDIAAGRVIFVRTSEPDVSTLKKRHDRGRLDVRPDFQRYEVWTPQKKSKLIESLLLDLPIPRIYLAEEPDNSQIVVDGQQRLLAIFQFLDNQLSLKGMTLLRSLEGKLFKELPDDLQEQIEKFQFSVVEIRKESDDDIKFDLFERLNTGSTQLNDQELRNSVFRGAYNDFLKALAREPDWRRLLGLKGTEPHKRMADVELVLRFMAFHGQTYLKHPDKKTSEFLNNQMRIGSTLKASDQKKAHQAFKDAIASVFSVFGSNAGKPFVLGKSADPEGHWGRTNRALLDVELFAFTRHPKGVITRNADALKEASIQLLSTPEFGDLISHTISEKKRIESRFRLWTDMVDKVVAGQHQGVRRFDRTLRQSLFKSNPTCHICGQAIAHIDDAHVDHVTPHRKGGQTAKANAALAHRFCNISKGANTVASRKSARKRA